MSALKRRAVQFVQLVASSITALSVLSVTTIWIW